MYDHADYLANPEKYKLFRTAKIRNSIITHNGENDLEAGEYVAIEYQFDQVNRVFKRTEPVYAVTKNGAYVTSVYANNLTNMVL